MTATIERMIERSQTFGHRPANAADQPSAALDRLRAAQADWQQRDFRERLQVVGRIAGLLASHGETIARQVHRPAATLGEILASELLPLAEACRYVGKRGGEILRPRRLRQGDGAWWMGSVQVTELREPLGVVLIIGPSNYPVFLPGVQVIQAIAAGNAVIVKPAPGCEQALESFLRLCHEAGAPLDLLLQLDSDPQASAPFVQAGVDKVIFTGSLGTGRQVAALCAAHMTPAAMELSGNDAVVVCEDADLSRVASSLAYALSLNGGQTCIAPRRVFATRATLDRLIPLLREELARTPERSIAQRGLTFAREAVERALAEGASLACGQLGDLEQAARVRPIVLDGVHPQMAVAQEDLFAPLLSLIAVSDVHEAIQCAADSRYALGAAIFGQSPQVERLASQILAGCVTVNDVLVPTADPRVSFGGRRASGFGVTRGLEGLRELTHLKVICKRRGRWLPHLTTSATQLAPMMLGILNLRYGSSWKQRWAGVMSLMKAGKQK